MAPFNATADRAHQDAWAKHVGQAQEVTNSIGMKPSHNTVQSPEAVPAEDDAAPHGSATPRASARAATEDGGKVAITISSTASLVGIDPENFTLQCLDEPHGQFPLIFGWGKWEHRYSDLRRRAGFRGLTLIIEPLPGDRDAAMRTKKAARVEVGGLPIARLEARADLQPGLRYRLVWNGRSGKGDKPLAAACEFVAKSDRIDQEAERKTEEPRQRGRPTVYYLVEFLCPSDDRTEEPDSRVVTLLGRTITGGSLPCISSAKFGSLMNSARFASRTAGRPSIAQ